MSETPPGSNGSPGAPYGGDYQPVPMRPEDEKLWSTLIHVGGILFSFVPALIGYFVLRDRGPFIKEHTRVALNFQLTMLIGYVGGWILSVIGIGILISFATWVVTIVFSVIAAVAANRGLYYRYPITIEWFKP
jgi:uncharacterized protein